MNTFRISIAFCVEYFQSPALGSRGEAAGRSFYDGNALAKLPYQQGALLAAHWNAALRQATGNKIGLDDVMRDLLQAARADSQAVTAESLADGGPPLRSVRCLPARFEQCITAGGTIQPDPAALGPGLTLHMARVASFELGFDAAATTARRVVTGVKPGSHAYWAGLRDGQEVLSCAPFVAGRPEPAPQPDCPGQRRHAGY